jgi:hypothetical protein
LQPNNSAYNWVWSWASPKPIQFTLMEVNF